MKYVARVECRTIIAIILCSFYLSVRNVDFELFTPQTRPHNSRMKSLVAKYHKYMMEFWMMNLVTLIGMMHMY